MWHQIFGSLITAVLVGHWFLVNIRSLILVKAKKYVQPPRLPACITLLTFPFLRDPDKALKPLNPNPADFWKLVLLYFVGGHKSVSGLVDRWQRDGSSSALYRTRGFDFGG